MQMAGGAVGVVEIVRYQADFLALPDMTPVENAVGIHARRVHVHIAKADMFVAGIDLQRRRLLFQRADQHAVADRDDALLIGLAFGVVKRTRRGPDILTLMAEAAGALSDAKTAGFAKIVLPGIAGVAAGQL